MEAPLCTCLNCMKVYIDHNPQSDAQQIDISGYDIDELILLKTIKDGIAEYYWACPECKTDGFLSDGIHPARINAITNI